MKFNRHSAPGPLSVMSQGQNFVQRRQNNSLIKLISNLISSDQTLKNKTNCSFLHFIQYSPKTIYKESKVDRQQQFSCSDIILWSLSTQGPPFLEFNSKMKLGDLTLEQYYKLEKPSFEQCYNFLYCWDFNMQV